MKVLTFHRFCLLAALALGLVCTWANAVPKVTSGDLFGGANCGCNYDLNWACSRAACNGSLSQCHNDPPGAWECVEKKSNYCTGTTGTNCKSWVGEHCD